MGNCCTANGQNNARLIDQNIRMEEFHFRLEKFMEETYRESSLSFQHAQKLLSSSKQIKINNFKNKLHNAIRLNIISDVYELISEKMVSIFEEIGQENYLWTSIHFACHFDRVLILKFLLNYMYRIDKQQYLDVVNQQTIEGWTPVMICCIYDNVNCLRILIDFGGVKLDIKGGVQNKTAAELSEFFQSQQCVELLSKYQDINNVLLNIDNFDKKDRLLTTYIQTQMDTENLQTNVYTKITEMDLDDYLQGQPNSNIRALIKDQIDQNSNFIDLEFPHSIDSLCLQQNHNNMRIFQYSKWLRLNELFSKDFEQLSLFEVIDPNCVKQGNLSTTYLTSIVLALAEFPQRIKNIFNNKKINHLGIYSVNMYVDGEPREIILDDYFPCFSDRNEYLFLKAKFNSCWAMFIEKAWAKTFQNYVQCEKMVVEFCLEDILGAPAQGYWVNNFSKEEIVSFFQQIQRHNFINIATSNFDIKKEDLLLAGHAYTILDIQESNIDKKFVVSLRNPWGKIYEEQKPVDSQIELDKNVIQLQIDEFIQKFQYFSISFIADDFQYNHLKFNSNNKHAYYCTIQVESETTIAIRLHQPLKRRIKYKDYNYCVSEFKLFQVTQDGHVKVLSEGHLLYRYTLSYYYLYRNYGNKSVPIDDKPFIKLKKGKYIIRTKLFWKQSQEVVISTYSDKKIVMSELGEDYGKRIMKEYYIYRVLQMQFKELKQPGYYFSNYWDGKYRMIMAFQNRNTDNCMWETSIDIYGKQNIKFSGQHQNTETLLIQVRSNQTEIVILKPVDINQSTSFIWQLHNKYVDVQQLQEQESSIKQSSQQEL